MKRLLRLPTNSWCHVAVTLDGSKGVLYLNGVPVATNNSLTIRPWQTLAKTNYIGHSQFSADPLFGGEISSFRIFGRALSGAEIKDLAYAPPALAHRYSFSSNISNVAWDSIGMAHGMLQGNAAITNNALQLTGELRRLRESARRIGLRFFRRHDRILGHLRREWKLGAAYSTLATSPTATGQNLPVFQSAHGFQYRTVGAGHDRRHA